MLVSESGWTRERGTARAVWGISLMNKRRLVHREGRLCQYYTAVMSLPLMHDLTR